MKVVIDKRKSNAIYVDKSNNHIANADDIIKLTFTDNSATINKYIAIIAGVYKLNNTEVAVLKYIIDNKYNSLSGQVCIAVAKIINKSTATIARAIDSLRIKRLIYIVMKLMLLKFLLLLILIMKLFLKLNLLLLNLIQKLLLIV